MKINTVQVVVGAVVGAVIGLILSILLLVAKDIMNKNKKFDGTLKKFTRRLDTVTKQVEDIEPNEKLETIVSQVQEEIREGEILIRNCDRVTRCQVCQRASYQSQLDKFYGILQGSYENMLVNMLVYGLAINRANEQRSNVRHISRNRGMTEEPNTSTAVES